MYLWSVIISHWLHVVGGIFWFGSVLYRNIILLPVVTELPLVNQRQVGKAVKDRANAIILPVSFLVIGLGILRGTIFGQIVSTDALFSNYGITWLTGLIVAILVLGWELFAVDSALENVYEDDDLWITPNAQVIATATNRVRLFAWIELGGFIVIFTCMILMRFGY